MDEELEKSAEKWVFEINCHKWSNNDDTAGDNYGSFINGANWQRNRLFTNEEVIDIIQKRLLSIGVISSLKATEIWFNQYKK